MATGKGALVSFDQKYLFDFAADLSQMSKYVSRMQKGILYWSNKDQGGGAFSPYAANAAAGFIRSQFDNNFADVPAARMWAELSDAWAKKRSEYGASGTLKLTGTLAKAIQVVRRREGAKRFWTVGVSRNLQVPKIGFGKVSSGELIRVSKYMEWLEFGTYNMAARPFMSSCIEVFITDMWPQLAKPIRDSFLRNAKSYNLYKKAKPPSPTSRYDVAGTNVQISKLIASGFSSGEEGSVHTEDQSKYHWSKEQKKMHNDMFKVLQSSGKYTPERISEIMDAMRKEGF
jgi:hypothetical protein